MASEHFPSSYFFLFPFMIVTICFSSVFPSTAYGINGNETDRQALLEFKAKITNDPFGVLSSWNDSIHFCHWNGVTCSPRQQRVTELYLYSSKIEGSISPHIGNLSFLKVFDLSNNSFTDKIPSEISHLRRLRKLWLHNNSLNGEIPSNISQCSSLIAISFTMNKLVGKIPAEFGSLSKLQYLTFFQNFLTGSIPPSLGNLSLLEGLYVSDNNLVGNIPDSLGLLRILTSLGLAMNHLTGDVPLSIFNLSSLQELDVGYNYKLRGNLPPNLFNSLPNLTFFSVISNQFTGSIPPSLSNASSLAYIELEDNKLTGQVPNLQGLNSLQILFFGLNNLGSGGLDNLDFLCSLTNVSTLRQLDISDNKFGAVLPKCIGNLTTNLTILWFANNHISGSIPIGIENLLNLADFWASNNNLSGTIPQTIGNLQNLNVMSLARNKFSGHIPSSLGNLIHLNRLNLSGNSLQGVIPSSLGQCKNLQLLDLSQNNINGTIPVEVASLSSLSIYLGLSQNNLTGPVPREIGKLKNLGRLEISDNMLSGEIPGDLGSCTSLEFLNMSGNLFQGSIPLSLSSLRGLQALDLSRNNLSGQIPEFLAGFPFLINLNLSLNGLEGMVPTEGVFKNASATSVGGNKELCGGIPEFQLPICNSKKHNKGLSGKLKAIIAILSGIVGVILVLLFVFLLSLGRKKEKLNSSSSGNIFPRVSYHDLQEATDGFSPANLLGVGSFGSVFKGILVEGGSLIAVKVINLQHHGATKSFLTECEALRNIRHRNLVKVLTACSSIDHQGNDFKALVYEFMANGSLEEWLHPTLDDATNGVRKKLTLSNRLNIAIDVADALEYLHGQCEPTIVHCDLKPSNVLLDDEMTAHVSDFGVAKLLSKGIQISLTNESSSVGVRGTIGYAPPEYGLGSEISASGDVYSYGIMLLEMITGKRPTSDMFKEGLNLHKLGQKSLLDGVAKIIDPILLEEIGTTSSLNRNIMGDNRAMECLITLVEVGVTCSAELPGERMNMSDVSTRLCSIREKLLRRGS